MLRSEKWEARLFMRPNTKILVKIHRKKMSATMCLFFNLTTMTGIVAKDTVVEKLICRNNFDNLRMIIETVFKASSFSEVSQKLLVSGNSRKNASPKIKPQVFEVLWQKNASAWWLMNAMNEN